MRGTLRPGERINDSKILFSEEIWDQTYEEEKKVDKVKFIPKNVLPCLYQSMGEINFIQ